MAGKANNEMADRYADLPDEAKAFLESINAQNIGDIHAAFRFYGRLGEPAKKFLLNAKPKTMEWLTEAREDEITKLDRTVKLANASQTVGKFLAWAIGIFIGMFMAAAQFGESIARLFNLIRGIKS